jgi:3-oxoacyl-[acyl-carrier protein] reductase
MLSPSDTKETMMMKLEGKAAIVTGGSRGIGAAIARRLARDGALIGIAYKNNVPAAERVAEELRASGARAEIFRVDVADENSVRAMVEAFVARFGKVDILINSAGIFDAAPVGEISRSMFHDQIFTNTWSVVAMTQAVLPYFPSSGGYVVNVSTSLVHEPGDGTAVYSASKAAVEVLTRGFAMELGARGIRVNAVAPHITRTDMTADIPVDHLARETALTPLRRLADPADIADVVAFLASDDARWITGRTILTDGGRM